MKTVIEKKIIIPKTEFFATLAVALNLKNDERIIDVAYRSAINAKGDDGWVVSVHTNEQEGSK